MEGTSSGCGELQAPRFHALPGSGCSAGGFAGARSSAPFLWVCPVCLKQNGPKTGSIQKKKSRAVLLICCWSEMLCMFAGVNCFWLPCSQRTTVNPQKGLFFLPGSLRNWVSVSETGGSITCWEFVSLYFEIDVCYSPCGHLFVATLNQRQNRPSPTCNKPTLKLPEAKPQQAGGDASGKRLSAKTMVAMRMVQMATVWLSPQDASQTSPQDARETT